MKKHLIMLVIAIIFYLKFCGYDYLNYHNHIPSPDGKFNFALYTDNEGIGDIEFLVLKIEKCTDPTDLDLKIKLGERNTFAESWIKKRKILSNYSEAGYNTDNPNIDLIDNKFICFSRGGYFYSLYDIETDRSVTNIYSPWHAWLTTYNRPDDKYDREKEQKSYNEWVKNELHFKINEYINDYKNKKIK